MKKLSILIVTIAVLSLSSVAYAAKNETGTQGASNQTGNQILNQNQVQTQNQSEDTQLQVNTQEQENLEEGADTGVQNRSQNAVENMSNVADQVQQLLQVRTSGGIGEQVRQIAQEQKQAQNQTQMELGNVDNRAGLLKSLIGPDYKALNNIQKVMEQNQLRIQQLEQLQNQLTNQSDITMIQETIQALTEQNIALQDRITLEEKSGSLLGWLFKLLTR